MSRWENGTKWHTKNWQTICRNPKELLKQTRTTMSDLRQFEQVDSSTATRAQSASVAASDLMNRVYLWMTVGLGLTGTVAMYIASSPELIAGLTGGTMFVLFLVQLGLVFWLSARVMHMQPITATLVFLGYSALTGVTLAPIFLVYTTASIGMTFLVTAGTFGAMATYGMITKTDLTKMGNILLMALIGLIIASVVNIFLGSSTMDLIISGLGVLIFTGLTAYDAQKIKDMSIQYQHHDGDVQSRLATLGALTLYLDFINLFLMLLRFLGDRR